MISRRMPRAVVALVSGGLDSLILVRTLLDGRAVVHPVYVRGGLVWEFAELRWVRRWLRALRDPRLKALRILDVSFRSLYPDHWSLTGRGVPSANSPETAVYLPGRNVLLLSAAAVYGVGQQVDVFIDVGVK